jgi:hypothetical protein
LEASLEEGGTYLVDYYFLLVVAMGGISWHLPGDSSRRGFGVVVGVIHIDPCAFRGMQRLLCPETDQLSVQLTDAANTSSVTAS